MEKSNQKSNISRQEGNEFYKNRQFTQALSKYNQSLCFSEKNSENLGLAYANRSAVYFEMKLFEKCLQNIDTAIAHFYPKENKHILETRRAKCLELMNVDQKRKTENLFKLSLPINSKIPFLAKNLELRNDKKFGRHIITTSDVSVGDVVAVDKPFCCVPISESQFVNVPEDNIYQRCNNCLKINHLNLYPCEDCCYAMFCSQQCHEFAKKYYHKYECPIISDIIRSGSVNMTLRIFFISLSVFEEDIFKLREFYEDIIKIPKTLFDFDFSSKNSSDNLLNQLKCLLSLSRSSKNFPLTQQKKLLANHPELYEIYNANGDFIKEFIQHQSQISDHNFHGIFSSNLNTQSIDNTNMKSLQEPVGSGSFLFASLINHSCVPNIMRICVDAEIYIIACRKIEKGSQIFDCYKNNFMMETKESRQINLMKEFNFKCECEACMYSWPTFKQLSVKDTKLMKYAKKLNDELIETLGNYNQLIKNFKNCKNILQENHKIYPSMELCVIQKTFATFLLKFAAQHKL